MTTTGPSAAGDSTPGSVRARVVLVRDGAIALIERRRDGRVYYAFPGGGVEPGETAEVAAAREAYEELGLRVAVGACIAELVVGDTRQRFFLAAPIGGTPGAGRGAEMMGEYPPARHLSRRLVAARRALRGDGVSLGRRRAGRRECRAGLADRAVAPARVRAAIVPT